MLCLDVTRITLHDTDGTATPTCKTPTDRPETAALALAHVRCSGGRVHSPAPSIARRHRKARLNTYWKRAAPGADHKVNNSSPSC